MSKKLIRDNVVQNAAARWVTLETRVLEAHQVLSFRLRKILEESQEVFDSEWDIEELADVLEVVRAIAKAKWFSLEELEEVRLKKLEERGWFDNNICLIYEDDEN